MKSFEIKFISWLRAEMFICFLQTLSIVVGIYEIGSIPFESYSVEIMRALLIAFLALNIWRWFCMINLSAHLECEPLVAYDE